MAQCLMSRRRVAIKVFNSPLPPFFFPLVKYCKATGKVLILLYFYSSVRERDYQKVDLQQEAASLLAKVPVVAEKGKTRVR